jgi:hypothetical protein
VYDYKLLYKEVSKYGGSRNVEFRPVREEDGGPVLNWLADQVQRVAGRMIRWSSRYALMYEADITEDDLDQPEGCLCGRGEGCCNG